MPHPDQNSPGLVGLDSNFTFLAGIPFDITRDIGSNCLENEVSHSVLWHVNVLECRVRVPLSAGCTPLHLTIPLPPAPRCHTLSLFRVPPLSSPC